VGGRLLWKGVTHCTPYQGLRQRYFRQHPIRTSSYANFPFTFTISYREEVLVQFGLQIFDQQSSADTEAMILYHASSAQFISSPCNIHVSGTSCSASFLPFRHIFQPDQAASTCKLRPVPCLTRVPSSQSQLPNNKVRM